MSRNASYGQLAAVAAIGDIVKDSRIIRDPSGIVEGQDDLPLALRPDMAFTVPFRTLVHMLKDSKDFAERENQLGPGLQVELRNAPVTPGKSIY